MPRASSRRNQRQPKRPHLLSSSSLLGAAATLAASCVTRATIAPRGAKQLGARTSSRVSLGARRVATVKR